VNGRRGDKTIDLCEAARADAFQRFGKGREIKLAEPWEIWRSRGREGGGALASGEEAGEEDKQ